MSGYVPADPDDSAPFMQIAAAGAGGEFRLCALDGRAQVWVWISRAGGWVKRPDVRFEVAPDPSLPVKAG